MTTAIASKSTPSTILQMPVELLADIFSSIDEPRTFFRFFGTCTSLKTMSQSKRMLCSLYQITVRKKSYIQNNYNEILRRAKQEFKENHISYNIYEFARSHESIVSELQNALYHTYCPIEFEIGYWLHSDTQLRQEARILSKVSSEIKIINTEFGKVKQLAAKIFTLTNDKPPQAIQEVAQSPQSSPPPVQLSIFEWLASRPITTF